MDKSPFEIRLETLKLAHEILESKRQDSIRKIDMQSSASTISAQSAAGDILGGTISSNITANSLASVQYTYDADELLSTASKLYDFVKSRN